MPTISIQEPLGQTNPREIRFKSDFAASPSKMKIPSNVTVPKVGPEKPEKPTRLGFQAAKPKLTSGTRPARKNPVKVQTRLPDLLARAGQSCVTPVKSPRKTSLNVKNPVRNSASHHMVTPEGAEKIPTRRVPRRLEDFVGISIRKSSRLTAKVKKEEEKDRLIKTVLSGEESSKIQIQEIVGKGRGLVAVADFSADEFVVEYAGDLVEYHEAKRREIKYADEDAKVDQSGEGKKFGCYMYFFDHRGRKLCVDATADTGRYGRLLNHSISRANLKTEVLEIVPEGKKRAKPYLILRASRSIVAGDELLYDYGDRSPAALEAFPWLKD